MKMIELLPLKVYRRLEYWGGGQGLEYGGGARFRILEGQGGQIPSRHMTSQRR